MKSKDKEHLKNMSDAELGSQLRDAEKKIFQLRFKRNTSPLENPLELRELGRKIALIKTWLRERELGKIKMSEVKR